MNRYEEEQNETYETEQKEQKDTTNKSKTFTDDEELPNLEHGYVIAKEEFYPDPKSMVIKDLFINRFGKPAIFVQLEDGTKGNINLPNQLFYDLKERLGSKKADWKGQTIKIVAEQFEGNEKRNMSAGYILKLVE